jgi:hypothetical protein
LCPPNKDKDALQKPVSGDDEQGKAIDLIISMMKNGNGDIRTPNQPEVMFKGNTLFYLQYSYICNKKIQNDRTTNHQPIENIFQSL